MSTRIDEIVGIESDLAVLARPYVLTIKIPGAGWTRKEQEPMVKQLRDLAVSLKLEEDGGNANGKPIVSKMPVSREDALSLVLEIERLASRYVKSLGASGSGSFISNCDYIREKLDELDDQLIMNINYEFHRLRHAAELLLQWEEPEGHVIGAKCPKCHARSSLRALVDWNSVTQVQCTKCEAVWGADDIGELSKQINKEKK